MEKYKYVILGAGPAGLAFANRLLQNNEDDFIVLEKDETAGGLCRSIEVDGSPLDIGGGHFLDVRNKNVNNFIFRFMPESEWNLYERNSKICFEGIMIDHPFEANIWQMPSEKQDEYLRSISEAGCNNGKKMPELFVDWIKWKLGILISENYMLPYNSKMFGLELNQLGTYWLEKLPNVSYEETKLSCINKKAYGTQPGHSQFYYPRKYGYGELWLRMASELGWHIRYSQCVDIIDFSKRCVVMSDGNKVKGDKIIITIPWDCLSSYDGMPSELKDEIKKLKHTSVNVTYYSDKIDTNAHWIYYPNLELPYHRILVRSNFCENSRGYWTETNSERYKDDGHRTFKNEYAYPLNTVEKPIIMNKILSWGRKDGIIGLGRWGEWEHYNSDVTVSRAISLADSLLCMD